MSRSSRIPLLTFISVLLMGFAVSRASSQTLTDLNRQAPPPFINQAPSCIVAAFLKSEARVRDALNQHTFKREVVLQTIGSDGQVTGEYIRHSQFLFDDKGNRIERVTFHPPSTIREMRITKQDIQDLAGAQLLGIDITETDKYIVTYVSKETLSGRSVYVLSVEPAVRPDPHRMSNASLLVRFGSTLKGFKFSKYEEQSSQTENSVSHCSRPGVKPSHQTFTCPSVPTLMTFCTFLIATSPTAFESSISTTNSSPAN